MPSKSVAAIGLYSSRLVFGRCGDARMTRGWVLATNLDSTPGTPGLPREGTILNLWTAGGPSMPAMMPMLFWAMGWIWYPIPVPLMDEYAVMGDGLVRRSNRSFICDGCKDRCSPFLVGDVV